MQIHSNIIHKGVYLLLLMTIDSHAFVGRLFPAAAGLLGISGCTELKSAGQECPIIDYTPEAFGITSQKAFEAVHEHCRLDLLEEWELPFDGPTLPDSCASAIVDLLPLDTSFRTGTAGAVVRARTNLARAFHTLLYFPRVDTGSIFGSESPTDYCPTLYSDFFGAIRLPEIPAVTFEDESENAFANFNRTSLHLARFLIERTESIRFTEGDGTWYAREQAGEMIFSADYGDLYNPFALAAVLVHETRHNAVGFPDGSKHVECQQGQGRGRTDCDDTMFGAYGSHIAFLDASLKGGVLSELADGTPLLSESQAKDMVEIACVLYQNAINNRNGALREVFDVVDCGELAGDIDHFLERHLGVPAGSARLRNH